MTVELYPGHSRSSVGPGMSSRRIFGSSHNSWTKPVVKEWELTAAQWTDEHPHDEFNYILEGELHVESNGELVIAHVGDLVRVVANSQGRYFAPQHARMLAIYDHNPSGDASVIVGLQPTNPD